MDEAGTKSRALVPVKAAGKATPTAAAPKAKRAVAHTKYAVYNLADALTVAQMIHQRGGGEASVDELAAYLGYSSSNNGAFFDRLSAARMFDFIQGQSPKITNTQRATDILMPVFPEQAVKAKVEAFLSVPLFGAIYEEFRGKQLPPETGLRNLLRTRYGVPASRIVQAYGSLMKSAEQAGFFSTRGTRTQLIVPRFDQVIGGAGSEEGADADEGAAADEGHGGDQGAAGGRRDQGDKGKASMADLRARYVSTLIDMLNKKDEPDPDLMAKIEGLLGFDEAEG